MYRYNDVYGNTITFRSNIIKTKHNNNSRLYNKGIFSNHCILAIPSIAKPMTYACTHGHTNTQSISQFCNPKSYKQYNIIPKTSISELMTLPNNKTHDYNNNINIPPQITTSPPTIETCTSETTSSHPPPITTINTYYLMREQYQG